MTADASTTVRAQLDPVSGNQLSAIAALLWPAGKSTVRTRPGRTSGATRSLWVVPGPANPRLLVPTGVSAAAVMTGRHSASGRQGLMRSAVKLGVRTGALSLLPAPRLVVTAAGGVDEYLGEALGRPLSVGVLLGPPRANGKPVLQAFDSAGKTVAFVKVAHNPLTRQLVGHEATTLKRLGDAGLRSMQVPDVLHVGEFGPAELLALGPLASSQQRRDGSADLPLAAMAELAGCLGTVAAPLGASLFTERLGREVAALPESDDAARLRRAWEGVLAARASCVLTFGSWHGDWAPWNMGVHHGIVQVWDWERFDDCVPVGFDPVHFRVQQLRAADATVADATTALRDDTAAMLARLGVSADDAALTAALYLAEVAARYLLDGGFAPSPALRARRGWILDTLDALLPALPKGTRTP